MSVIESWGSMPEWLKIKTGEKAFLIENLNQPNSYFSRSIANNVLIEAAVAELAHEPDAEMEKLLAAAEKFINHQREKIGYEAIEAPKIYLMTAEDYKRFLTISGRDKTDEKYSIALALTGPRIMVIIDDMFPSYFVAGMMVHELGHIFLTKVWGAINREVRDENGIKFLFVREAYFRHGTSLMPDFRGPAPKYDFIQELTMFSLQKEVMAELKEAGSSKSGYEFEKRKRQLRKRAIKPGGKGKFWVRFDEKERYRLTVDQENLHFNNEGELIIFKGLVVTVMFQILTELERRSKKTSKVDVVDLLRSSQIDPRIENQLRCVVDAGYGEGFYKKLRQTHYQSSLATVQLLAEMQKKK